MPFKLLSSQALPWLLSDGITLALLVLCAVLLPRLGRYAIGFYAARQDAKLEESKTRKAVFGTLVYLLQIGAYFFLLLALLKTFGFSTVGAAVPATVISAALGFGAQSVISDFLAGFFILQEKQFGLGDWVCFSDGSINVEGEVIRMTMRATTVRTLSGDTVVVANSVARVAINSSNQWARAVVLMPIPLSAGTTIFDAISRSEFAASRALTRPDIAADIRGPLEVHPAVDIERPSVLGMPWIVQIRFVVQVNPARQWVVERAIRTEILAAFQQEYSTVTATPADQNQSPIPASQADPQQLSPTAELVARASWAENPQSATEPQQSSSAANTPEPAPAAFAATKLRRSTALLLVLALLLGAARLWSLESLAEQNPPRLPAATQSAGAN